MKKLLLFLIACATFGTTVNAQLVQVTHEVFYTDDGTVLGYPAGFTTYRIYADLQDPADFLSSGYAAGNDAMTIGSSTNTIWNDPFGSFTGDAINPLLFGAFPDSEYDSMVTIGRANSGDPGGGITAISSNPDAVQFETHFGVGGAVDEFDTNMNLLDGAYFTPNGNVNGNGIDQGGPGPYRVLLAQVTTDGDVEYTMNLQVFDEGDGVLGFLLYVGDCATVDGADNDASCLGAQYPQVCACPIPGCTDPIACNYDPLATVDDLSCVYGPANDACANATPIGAGTLNIDNTGACYNEGAAGSCHFGADPELASIWFEFTTPAADAEVRIFTEGDGSFSWTDTQLTVFDGCGGAEIACDDDDDSGTGLGGGGLFSAIVIPCGTLAPSTTYLLQVDDFGTATFGTCDLTLEIDEPACTAAVDGCTDPLACDYDPLATNDTGCCFDNCVTLTVGGGSFGSEVSWDLYDSGANLIATGGTGVFDLCLADDCYTYDMFDSFGDGWNGNTYDFSDGGGTIASGDMDTAPIGDGSDFDGTNDDFGTAFIDIGGTGTCPVFGCTDPLACNYDPAATLDDGSCSNDNDAFACATVVTPSGLNACNFIAGDLTGSTPSPEASWDFTNNNQDRWYEFTAASPGVSITVSTTDFDAQIAIYTLGGVEVDEEDANFSVGDEVLNYGSLTEGDTYRVTVASWGAITTGLYDLCIETLPDTRCDYGPGPYDLCDQFKADWVGADDYIFTFTGTDLTDYVHQSFAPYTFVQLFTVADLPWGDDYNVAINSVYNRVDGNGAAETVVVDNNEPCAITVNPQPAAALRTSDNCANYGPHFLGDYVAAAPWICGASDWTWFFQRTDVAELPITHLRGAANRFMRLSDVPGLQPGGTYDVQVKPEFSNGAATVYGGVECLQIVGIVPGTEGDGPIVVEMETERIEDVVTTPEAALYPNPTNGEFVNLNLSGVESEIVTVDVYDIFGKLVMSEQITVAGGSVNHIMKFNDEVASGVYMVNITMDGTVQTERLVIEK